MIKTAVSLFAGAGGCTLGFSWAGFKILLAIDHFKDAVSTYELNFPDTPCWQQDIRDVSPEAILSTVGLKAGELDFLIGGPPCQGFSSAGAKFWEDPRNELLKHYLRLLEGIKPQWFLMENVEGLLTADRGRYIYELTKGFLEAGYSVQLHKVYSHWYGLPQERKRVFMIGTRQVSHFTLPEPTHSEVPTLFDAQPVLNIMDAISDLPAPCEWSDLGLDYTSPPKNAYQRLLRGECVTDHWIPSPNGETLERIKALDLGQSMKDLPQNLQHASFKRRAFRRVMDGIPSEKRGGAPSGLKRLYPNRPSLTITSAAIREFIHPYEDRFLTLRECARIQSFPDNFAFVGNPSSVIRMIGNAIPPLIAKTLAEHFLRQTQGDEFVVRHPNKQKGHLLGYYLTKADSMSPALAYTDELLRQLLQRDH